MKFSQLVSKTMRDEPAEAEMASHRLMLKTGMIQQVASGIYSYLPLGWRTLRKVETIIREEIDATGGQEIRLPVLQPIELWEETGRRAAFGPNLFALEDRRGRSLVLAPTHEEVITNLVRSYVQSYRDLPVILYQIQTKFRDEARPRGGLIRVREFDMKDAYSFNANDISLSESYSAMAEAYRAIYKRCALPVVMVEADSGAIGGKDSNEFILPSLAGEDTVLTCPKCGYAANAEKAQGVVHSLKPEPLLPLEPIPTPGVATIPELCEYLDVPPQKTLKAVFYWADGEIVFATIRGELEVNEVKLKNVLGCHDLRLAEQEEVSKAGLVAGSASPIGLAGIQRIADESIRLGTNFVVGANKHDTHFRNANFPRDFEVDVITDIALARENDSCINCGTALQAIKGIEVGHIFKLGTFFTENQSANFLDEDGRQRPITMGCYGIGVGRLLAAIIEQNHDEKGIVFPPQVAPYQAHLVALNLANPTVAHHAEDLYHRLLNEGIETLYDDRIEESAGVKFNDADLLGLPLRLVISPRTLKESAVEVRTRHTLNTQVVQNEEIVTKIREMLREW